MNKHQPYDLKQMQSVPLEGKIIMTKQRIRQWYDHYDGMVYLSFSGGKDSTVLKHIIDSMYSDVPSVFVNTGLEYPEIQKFAMAQENVIAIRPEMRFDQVIKQYGYPVISKEIAKNVQYARAGSEENIHYKKLFGTLMYDGKKSRYCCDNWAFLYDAPFKISASCCDKMKKAPSHLYEKQTGRKPIIATMADESEMRRVAWLKNGCNAFGGKRPRSAPLSFWTEQDILHYLVKYDVPYCSVYGDIKAKTPDGIKDQMTISDYLGIADYDHLEMTGCQRTGCIFCMFGCHLDEKPNRFQRLKESHPKQYQYCIGGGEMVNGLWQPNKKGLGLAKVLDYIGVDY